MGKAVLDTILGKVLLGIVTAALWFVLAEASHAEHRPGVDLQTPGAIIGVSR